MTLEKFKHHAAILQEMMQPKVTYITKERYYRILMDKTHPLHNCLKHEWNKEKGDMYCIIH